MGFGCLADGDRIIREYNQGYGRHWLVAMSRGWEVLRAPFSRF